jgi:hypothetical protein
MTTCTEKRMVPAPIERGIYRSQRVLCPHCGKIVTVHPNGNLAPHRLPTARTVQSPVQTSALRNAD